MEPGKKRFLRDPINPFAGDSALVDVSKLARDYGFNIEAQNPEFGEKQAKQKSLGRSGVRICETEDAFKIFENIINFENFDSFIKTRFSDKEVDKKIIEYFKMLNFEGLDKFENPGILRALRNSVAEQYFNHLAKEADDSEIKKFLIENKIDINEINLRGRKPGGAAKTAADENLDSAVISIFRQMRYNSLGYDSTPNLLTALEKVAAEPKMEKVFNYLVDEATDEEIGRFLLDNKIMWITVNNTRIIVKSMRDLAAEVLGDVLVSGLNWYILWTGKTYDNYFGPEDEKLGQIRIDLAKKYYGEFIEEVVNSDFRAVYDKISAYFQRSGDIAMFRNYPDEKLDNYTFTTDRGMEKPENNLFKEKCRGYKGIYNFINYMMQMFFKEQMQETVDEIDSSGRKIYFTMNFSSYKDKSSMERKDTNTLFLPWLVRYYFSMGFDGVILSLSDIKTDELNLASLSDDLKEAAWGIKTYRSQAKIFIDPAMPKVARDILAKEITCHKYFPMAKMKDMQLSADCGDMLSIDKLPESDAQRQALSDAIGASGVRNLAVKANVVFGSGSTASDGNDAADSLPEGFENEKYRFDAFFDEIIYLVYGKRPSNPYLLKKMGHEAGINFSSVPELDQSNLESVAKDDKISFKNPESIKRNGLLGLMKALYLARYKKEEVVNKKDCGYILKLIIKSLENTPGLERKNWKEGWIKLNNFERRFRDSGEEDKEGYVNEALEYVRGIAENMFANDLAKSLPGGELGFEDKNDYRTFASLLMMHLLFNFGSIREIPDKIKDSQEQFLSIINAKKPIDLLPEFPNPLSIEKAAGFLENKSQNLYKHNTSFSILAVKAFINFRSFIEKNPSSIEIPQDVKDCFESKRLREFLNPAIDDVYNKGVISDLSKKDSDSSKKNSDMSEKDLEEYRWAVSELFNLFFLQIAERKQGKALERQIKGSILNRNAIKSITAAA